MQILHVSPVLPTDVCAQTMALANHGWLRELYTSTAISDRGGMGRLLNRWMDRRRIGIASKKLHSVVLSDYSEKWRLLAGRSRIEAADARFKSVDLAASRGVGRTTDAVYCREDAAYHTFRRAREAGAMRIYDLPTAHFGVTRDLMKVEVECFPELADGFSMSEEYSPQRLARKQCELESADDIICPSQFVKRSLMAAGVAAHRIHVLPFACDPHWLQQSPAKRGNTVLFVGQISARKGVHRLLRAWKSLGAHRTHRLRLVGNMRLPEAYLNEFKGLYDHIPALPRTKLFRQYASAKLFVANFMSEGMAVVIPEALSAGTPVIASRNSGGEEIISDNEDGLLVAYGDDDALATAIDGLLSSPEQLAYMSDKAVKKARSRTWDGYALGFIECMQSILNGRG